MRIRRFQQGDELALRAIFFNTIRHVNIKDYSEAQVQAWAPAKYDPHQWNKRMSEINPFVAVLNDQLVGYADIQDNGYIDHFFCHCNYQGKGIGKALINEIFKTAQHNGIRRVYSHVSITAKPFFEHFGFTQVKQQTVNIRGQVLTQYVMEKRLEIG
ncbi:GNAT family N-acetyltransferase [Thalassotalea ponticola]|uniref:GNAT family N-acetyltransferase n=1 Tax=Thalassotalea ponticola TaxID=1523392 RepID=UPI0025B462AB|nr:GNAT family N-acetyltransferase [Thalassotalea ponticola]MDN3653035.1 GNAT family N-acetyltransferase [Thalassotalea ponticola]